MFPRLSTVFRYSALIVLVLVSGVMIFQLGANTNLAASGDLIVNVVNYDDDMPYHRDDLRTSRGVFRPTTSVKRGLVSQRRPDARIEDQGVVNPHTFKYRINTQTLCTRRRHVFLVTYVHSAPANFNKRQTIRDTWGNHMFLKLHNITVVFIMGTVADLKVMQLVDMESSRYGDLVQEEFLDSYRNLTHKAIAGIKWVSTFCPRARFVLKTDDDILVNFHLLIDVIKHTVETSYGTSGLIMCNLWVRMKVMRDIRSKWYIPKADFSDDYFPPYCSGSAYLMSADVVDRMYRVSMTTPFFWVDDYYVTGMLARKLNITHRRYNQAYVLHPGVVKEKYDGDQKDSLVFFHIHKLRTMYKLWKNMTMKYAERTALSPRSLQSQFRVTYSKTVLVKTN